MLSSRSLSKLILNTGLGALLILIWLHFVNISSIFSAISRVSSVYVLTFILLYLLAGVFRATRLKLLLFQYKLSLKELIPLNYLCQLLTFAIPIRAGEIAKSVYLTKRVGGSACWQAGSATTPLSLTFAKSLVWVFLDRFLDFLGVVFIVAVLIFRVPNNLPDGLQKTIAGLFIIFAFLAILMIKSQRLAKKLIDLAAFLLFFKKARQIFLKFSLAIVEEFPILYTSLGRFLALCLLTVLAIGADTLNIYLLLTAVGIKVAFLKALLGSALTILTFIVPAAPGYLGSTEAVGLAVYSGGLGINADLVSAAVVLFHILNLVFVPVIGIISLYLLKFDLHLVWDKLKRQ